MKGFEITNSWYEPPEILASKQGLTTLFFKPIAKKPPKSTHVVRKQELTGQYLQLLMANS